MNLHRIIILSSLLFVSCELDQSVTLDQKPEPPALVSSTISPLFINIAGNHSGTSVDTSITIHASLDKAYPKTTNVFFIVLSPNGNQFTSGVLADNGILPDQTASDGVYSIRKTLSFPKHVIGTYNVQIYAKNSTGEESISISLPLTLFNTSNNAPVLTNLFAPDTVFVPTGSAANLVKISVTAADSQGLTDIVSVTLQSLRPDSTVAGLFPLYDDGAVINRPTFGITSGDSLANDGRYTIVIPIFSSTQKNTYRDFIFRTTDRSNAVSIPIIHRVFIQ